MSTLWRDITRFVSPACLNTLNAVVRLRANHVARRRVLAGLVLGAALALAFSFFGRAALADDSDAPKAFVNDTAAKAIQIMADKSAQDTQRVDKFRTLFDASFDLPAIGQQVLGRYWKTASSDQQQQFMKLFEEQEVLVWSARFKSYDGQKLTVEGATPDATTPGRWHVTSHIDQSSGKPIPLEWQIAQANGSWRILDLSVAGVSMALTLHQDFGAVLQANSGKMDGLLDVMQKKINQLRAS